MTNPEVKSQINDQMNKMAIPPVAIARASVFAIEQQPDVDVNEIVISSHGAGLNPPLRNREWWPFRRRSYASTKSVTGNLTLKAFANSSPGLRFGNPGITDVIYERRNSEGVASGFANHEATRNSFRVAKNLLEAFLNPGFQSKPWAGISQRFQRYVPRSDE